MISSKKKSKEEVLDKNRTEVTYKFSPTSVKMDIEKGESKTPPTKQVPKTENVSNKKRRQKLALKLIFLLLFLIGIAVLTITLIKCGDDDGDGDAKRNGNEDHKRHGIIPDYESDKILDETNDNFPMTDIMYQDPDEKLFLDVSLFYQTQNIKIMNKMTLSKIFAN